VKIDLTKRHASYVKDTLKHGSSKTFLTFMNPCIVNMIKKATNKMQATSVV